MDLHRRNHLGRAVPECPGIAPALERTASVGPRTWVCDQPPRSAAKTQVKTKIRKLGSLGSATEPSCGLRVTWRAMDRERAATPLIRANRSESSLTTNVAADQASAALRPYQRTNLMDGRPRPGNPLPTSSKNEIPAQKMNWVRSVIGSLEDVGIVPGSHWVRLVILRRFLSHTNLRRGAQRRLGSVELAERTAALGRGSSLKTKLGSNGNIGLSAEARKSNVWTDASVPDRTSWPAGCPKHPSVLGQESSDTLLKDGLVRRSLV